MNKKTIIVLYILIFNIFILFITLKIHDTDNIIKLLINEYFIKNIL